MPVDQLLDISRLRQKKENAQLRNLAAMLYNCASLIAVGFHDPKHFPTLEETFPQLFDRQEQAPVQQDWRVMKQRVEDFAARRQV